MLSTSAIKRPKPTMNVYLFPLCRSSKNQEKRGTRTRFVLSAGSGLNMNAGNDSTCHFYPSYVSGLLAFGLICSVAHTHSHSQKWRLGLTLFQVASSAASRVPSLTAADWDRYTFAKACTRTQCRCVFGRLVPDPLHCRLKVHWCKSCYVVF